MLKPFRKLPYSLDEVHQFVGDLDRLTLLRDKSKDPEEQQRYARMVDSASRLLEHVLDKMEGAS